jgi:predicted nucleotidyltransferase
VEITIPVEEITAFCRKHHIRRLSLFGSVLRDDFNLDSDIDVLVEFETGHAPGWEFVAMQDELSTILGRKVDLNTAGFLSRHFRQKVLDTAQVVYERAG